MFYKNNSKKIINTKFSLVVCLLFLLYFFSNNLIYATSLTKTKNDFLIPVGNVLHIEAQLENVIVRSNIKDSPFTLGENSKFLPYVAFPLNIYWVKSIYSCKLNLLLNKFIIKFFSLSIMFIYPPIKNDDNIVSGFLTSLMLFSSVLIK